MSRDFTIPDSPFEYVMLTLKQVQTLTLSEIKRVKSNRKNALPVMNFASFMLTGLNSLKRYHEATTQEDKDWHASSFNEDKKQLEWLASEQMYGKETYAVYFSKELEVQI